MYLLKHLEISDKSQAGRNNGNNILYFNFVILRRMWEAASSRYNKSVKQHLLAVSNLHLN